ncbi:CocE/NonD family hydrolase [Amycolatopsis pigmentata]|uniref:CocE/NonD family hydrolase n=1 Tax=Amycolatopsis pigmentata TaxID=450801 RepID=A0ABW5FKN9_9PSEU
MSEIRIEFDVPAQMRDGTVLKADIYRPAGDRRRPVLLSRLPYNKSGPVMVQLLNPVGLAKRGYIVVLQDTRGRFASEGEWDPLTYEEQDGYDTVRWAASLPGANGSVGMYGASYLGNAQWMAALAKPPELTAIAPMMTWSEPDDGLFARGGATEFGFCVPWSLLHGLNTVIRRHAGDPDSGAKPLLSLIEEFDDVASKAYQELPAGRPPVFRRQDVPEIGSERSRRESGWSSACRIAGRHAEIDLPSLTIGGWYDMFLQGSLDGYMAMRAAGRPANLVVGPWVHGATFGPQTGDVNFGLAASGDLLGLTGSLTDIQADWFARWLPGADEPRNPSGAGLPPVFLFVMGANTWRAEQSWPLERAVDTSVYLRAEGSLSLEPPSADEGYDAYAYDPADPCPTTGGAILMSTEYRSGPVDQAAIERRADLLVYDSAPLESDVEVTGRIKAILHTRTDAPSTDWVVRLCDVDPSGRSLNVVDGIARVEGQQDAFAENTVDLWSTSYLFKKGHRLRVHLTSSNFPRWDRNLNTGESIDTGTAWQVANQQVVHDAARPSRIVLPIVPGPQAG